MAGRDRQKLAALRATLVVRRGTDLARGLLQAVLCLGIVELDGADAAQVVQVAAQLLRAARHLRPLRLAAQLLSLAATGDA